jgi:hydroxyacyl-ACP dehydratase HTD2-like protein with hotdog domain
MLRLEQIQPGDELPQREFNVDNVQLFLYNAVLWNAHRIHFDQPYAKEVEGYPGLVIAGPLMGDWISQCVTEWLDGSGRLVSMEYHNRQAAYIGDVLFSGGVISAVDRETGMVSVELFIRNQQQQVIIPGVAEVHFATA